MKNSSNLCPGKNYLRRDSAILVFLVVLSALPYTRGINFYSDDWGTLSIFVHHQSDSAWQLFRNELANDTGLRVRPVQALYLVLSFKSFGLNPLPYHVIGAVVLALSVTILYWVLRELIAVRGIALAFAAVYGVLPHYSTDRFWVASQLATFSTFFAFLGIWSVLRLISTEKLNSLWGVVAAISFILSLLSYEVTIGLIAAALVFTGGLLLARRAKQNNYSSMMSWLGVICLCVLVLGITKSAIQSRLVLMYHHHLFESLRSFFRIVAKFAFHAVEEAFDFNLWTYFVHLPWTVWGLAQRSALSTVTMGVGVCVGSIVAAVLWTDRSGEVWSAIANVKLAAIGLTLYFLGTLLFILDLGSNFSAPGFNNRVTVASALGAAAICVAVVGLISRFLGRAATTKWRVFSVLIGVMCCLYCFVIGGIASFWIDAANKQAHILLDIKADFPLPPKPNSILLLDGFCRYDGPSIIFETEWDTTGALQILYGDNSLIGDVISNKTRFDQTAVYTTDYDEPVGHYPYNNQLFVYNVAYRSLHVLDSPLAADNYLKLARSTREEGCPTERDGYGARIF